MILSKEQKNDIRWLTKSGDYDIAYKSLFKLYNSNIKKITDRWFVSYNLTLVCKKLDRIEEAKKYSIITKDIIENEDEWLMTERGMTLWLYIELNKNDIHSDELLKSYIKLKKYFEIVEADEELIIGINCSISFLRKEYDVVIDILNYCLDRHYIHTINSIKLEAQKVSSKIHNRVMGVIYNNTKMYIENNRR